MSFLYKQVQFDIGNNLADQMSEHGKDGWEYCFHLQLFISNPLTAGQQPPQSKLLVFFKKRTVEFS